MVEGLDFTKPILHRKDGSLVVIYNGLPNAITSESSPKTYALALARPELIVEEPEPPEPTAEEKAAIARAYRDAKLHEAIDTYNAVRWEAMNEAEKTIVRAYRQALIDWPESVGFPDLVTLPTLASA